MEKQHKSKCYYCKGINEYIENKKPKECPLCKIMFWDKPKLERDLFIIQEEYLTNSRNKDILSKMYPILLNYSRLLILKKIKNKIILTTEDLRDHCHYVAERIIRYYLKYDSWKVDGSFAGIMSIGPIRETLYGDKKNDQILSLNFKPHKAEKNNEELGDLKNSIGVKDIIYKDRILESGLTIKDVIYEIHKVIERIKFEKGEKESFYTLTGLKIMLEKKGDKVLEDFYSYSGNENKKNVDDLFSSLYTIIKNDIYGIKEN